MSPDEMCLLNKCSYFPQYVCSCLTYKMLEMIVFAIQLHCENSFICYNAAVSNSVVLCVYLNSDSRYMWHFLQEIPFQLWLPESLYNDIDPLKVLETDSADGPVL